MTWMLSVGMLNMSAHGTMASYLKKIHDLLIEDGVAVIHFIGRMEPPNETAPWLNKYIFPGGYAPALSEVYRHSKSNGSS